MQTGRRSRTSEWVAAIRALYTGAPDGLEIAPDDVAASLLSPLLRWQVRLLTSTPLATRVGHLAVGALTRGVSHGVALRTAAIDDALRDGLSAGIRQLVLLGAGLDARAFRMAELGETRVFELDHPDTQSYKRARVGTRAPRAREVVFCAIDFERDRIGDVLVARDFCADEPSFWIWEGVTIYLTPAAIRASLDAIAALSAPRSRIALTYTTPDIGASPLAREAAAALARLIGEPLHGHIETAVMHAELDRRGFGVQSDEAANDWARRYWPPSEHQRGRAYERLVVARRRG
jgi:methyltransferase (TIGR00027 family)